LTPPNGEVPGLLSLRFHTPDHDFEVADLKSGSSPDVRAVEGNHHRTGFNAAHPMWVGIVEILQTIRSPSEAKSDARMVGGPARRQQHAHHPSGLSKRQSGAEFGLDAHKLQRGSPSDQRRCPARTTCVVALRLRLKAIASA